MNKAFDKTKNTKLKIIHSKYMKHLAGMSACFLHNDQELYDSFMPELRINCGPIEGAVWTDEKHAELDVALKYIADNDLR